MEVKGIAVETFQLFVTSRFGAEGWARWLAALPEASRPTFTTPVDSDRWYDYEAALLAPTRLTCELFFDGQIQGAREMGRFSADHGLRGPKRLLARFISPMTLIERGVGIIQRYYRPLAVKVRPQDPQANLYQVDLSGMDIPSPLFDNRIAGWIERALEITGVKGIAVPVLRSADAPRGTSVLSLRWQ